MNKNDIMKARTSGHQAKLIIKELIKDDLIQAGLVEKIEGE